MKSKDHIKKFRSSRGAETEKEIKRLQTVLYDLYSDAAGGKIKNVRETKITRKQIAQLKTLLEENNER